jgi:hypothetical protein
VCGWDTRAGTRVCASCRAEQESLDTTGDGVLAGVLQQARDMTGDAGHPPEAGETTSRRPRGARRDDDGREQVVLREIEPGGDEVERPRRSEPSSVAASLLAAFQRPQDTGTVDPPPAADPVGSMADTDRLEAVAAPTVGDEGQSVEARSPDADGTTTPPAAAGAQARADAPARPWPSPDDSGPITDRFANIPTVPMDPGPSPDLPAGTDPASASPGAGQDATGTPAWRAALHDAGTWTAVAQFTLLFIAMLCVFQVVVLVVVNRFLSQALTQAAVAADMLAAHAKVATVMLPALFGGASAAAALAAWRARTDPQPRDDTAWLRRWVLGLPVAIWGVIVTATVLLMVVLFGAASTVVEAQRTTLWAIGVCTLLGIACVVAPRGLAAPQDDDADDAGGESRTDDARR